MAPESLEVRIDFNVNDTPSSIRAFLRRLAAVWSTEAAAVPVVLDLSKCQYVGPDCVILTSSTLLDLRAGARAAQLVPPVHPRALAYCRYAGLLAVAEEGAPPKMHAESGTMPLRRFRQYDHVGMDEVIRLVRRYLPMTPDTESVLRAGISELMQNVLDHSESRIGGLLSALAFKDQAEVRFAIGDAGRGIPATMRSRYPRLMRDEDCLLAAFEGRKSAKSRDRNQGMGLASLKALVEVNGGELALYSGSACAILGRRGRFAVQRLDLPLRGTMVAVTFRVDNDLYRGRTEKAEEIEL